MSVLYRLKLFRSLTEEEKNLLDEKQLSALLSIHVISLKILGINDRRELIEWLPLEDIKKLSVVHRKALVNMDSDNNLLEVISSKEKRNFLLGDLDPSQIRKMKKEYRVSLYRDLSEQEKELLDKEQTRALLGKNLFREWLRLREMAKKLLE